MLGDYAGLSARFWVDLCYNFGLILLIIVCVAVVLLLLCCCHVALSDKMARSGKARASRALRPTVEEPSAHGFNWLKGETGSH